MADYGTADLGFVLLGGRDILGAMTEIQDSNEAIVDEITWLGVAYDSWKAVGVNKGEVKLLGLYNTANPDNPITAFEVITAQELMYALEGNTIGNEAAFMNALREPFMRSAERDKIHRIEAEFKGASGLNKGLVIASHLAKTDTDVTATVDNLASSANGSVSALAISSLTLGGYTNVIIKLRDSTDDISFVDHATFTAVTSAPASERVVVSGTVNRYVQTQVNFTGAGSSESVKYAVVMERTTNN